MSRVDGTAPTLSEQLNGNQARLRKQSLGRFIQEYQRVVTEMPLPPEAEIESAGSGIAYSVQVAFDVNVVKRQRQALSRIVAERNKLIHQDLIYLDGTSIKDY